MSDSNNKNFFLGSNRVAQVIFIVIILYAVSSINVLLLALGVLPYIPRDYFHNYVLVIFAIISFGITLLISGYHLSTMIRRRKRRTDFQP